MDYQKLRDNKSFWIGGVSYLGCYAIYTAVYAISKGIKDITGLYLLIPFAILIFASFIYSSLMLKKAFQTYNDEALKHNFPFWLSVWGDLGYACMIYCVTDLIFRLANFAI